MIHSDIIICGTGPAGIAAAIQASGTGADTLLIEKDSTVGGMSTLGLLNIFCGVADCTLFNSILQEIVHPDDEGRLIYDPEELSAFYYRILEKSKAKLLLGTKAASVKIRQNRIESICAATPGGLEELQADMWIDASGDGVLAAGAGVPFRFGRKDGAMQPMSMMVMLGGIQNATHITFQTDPALQAKMRQYSMTMPGSAGHVIIIPCVKKSYVILNMTNCTDVNGTDVADYSHAQVICRQQAPAIVDFLKENVPGYENCYIVRTAAYAGVRESRHFVGLGTITANDIRNGRIFPDWCVSKASMSMNLHNTQGAGQDQYSECASKPYTIPYAALICKRIGNLILSGRMISGTHKAHGSYRAMAICMATGQAAGAAAKLCMDRKCQVQKLDVKTLQSELLKAGISKP